ncbi:hypothetical protein HJC23_003552 [Cyclotella cryptica]|uniref:Kinesin motor domain-containing protein n=1 Tax=Cyclotella cryptica TaxID=29204 RepID=A0ABD3PJE2_9STRA
MATVEEKQAELDALQTAFDEYIVSSRELEEELDAELSKCQNDLSKAQSRNSALASQLSSLSPQLTALEAQLSNLTTQLHNETQRRIAAENAAEEAENASRRLAASATNNAASGKSEEEKKWKEEREELLERLAFVEGECEEWKRELEEERERWRGEMEEVQGDLMVCRERLKERQEGADEGSEGQQQQLEQPQTAAVTDSAEQQEVSPVTDKQEEYIKTLEDELELVTEQLIEAETKLSRTQAELEEALAAINAPNDGVAVSSQERISELEERVRSLEEERLVLKEELRRRAPIDFLVHLTIIDFPKHKTFNLELALSNDELKAAEEDGLAASKKFDTERKQLKDEISILKTQLDKIKSEERSNSIQSKSWEEALLSSEKQTQLLQEQVARLEIALQNSKNDCESLQNEMDELKAAFDDASTRDKVEVMEELLTTRSREVEELKEEVKNLTQTNSSLSQNLRNTESELKMQCDENEEQKKVTSSAESTSEQLEEAQFEILSLEGLLEETRKDLSEEREKVEKVRSSLQEKIASVQKELDTAEKELEATRLKLVEAEEQSRRGGSSRMASEFLPNRPKKELMMSLSDGPLNKYSVEETDSSIGSEFYRSHALSRRIFSHKSRNRPRSCSPTTVQRLERDAEERTAATATLQNECEKLEDQNRMSVSMKSHLEKEIRQLQKQLLSVKSKISTPEEDRELSPDMLRVSTDDGDIEDVLKSNDSEKIAHEFRLMAKKISAQKTHNAELLTRILKLQGNIQVCCRVRPLSMDESQKGYREVAQALSETELGCFDERTKTWKSYAFDKVWGPETRQRDVFQDVEPMALSVVDGYNACIFAYGQTGSGKTYTMEGDKAKQQYGISQRTIHNVFSMLEDKAQQQKKSIVPQDDGSSLPTFEYSIEVGMLEIYNDEVYDLLAPSLTKDSHGTFQRKSLDIRHGTENTIEVPGLTKEKVTNVNEVLAALDRGNSNRATSSTNLNERSSRSHMILQVEVTSGVGEAKHKASLYLVDLAGSERVRKSEVEGKALKEAQHINKSLSALGNVMEALDQKSSHIPYRDSKLTYLLQNSLGGNSRTMMIVTVCPSNLSYDESTFALKFATRVRRINLGTAHRNISAKNLEETIKNLNSQISLLSKSKERSDSQLLTLKREKERIQEKLDKASSSRVNSKEEMRTLTVLRNSNHDITSRWQKEKAIREEKTAELEKAQEELRRVQKDLVAVKRDHESLAKKLEDKENSIFELKKDLRSVKEQLNTEKIRHRRAQVVHSRIPAPSLVPRSTASSSQKSSIPIPSSYTRTNGAKNNTAPTPPVTTSSDPNVARIRARVLKLLQEHDPQKVNKLESLMKQFEGREYELLEKMNARYEKAHSKDFLQGSADTGSTTSSPCTLEDRPISRQQKAIELHKARMQGIKDKL